MGLAHHNQFIFIASGFDYTCHYVDYFNSDSLEVYLQFINTGADIYDITYDDGDIWLAAFDTEYTVRKYDTYGAVIDFLEISLIPQASGLAMDPDGYLWVSDIDNDLIYQVDLEVALDRSTWGWVKANLW